jgi:hypothetical protein
MDIDIEFLLGMAIWCAIVGLAVYSSLKKNKGKTISSDGHAVAPGEDLTCENQYGHHHDRINGQEPRYVVHSEPTSGYVVLNGVKRKLSDCRDL